MATRTVPAAALFAVPFAAHGVGYDAALPAFGIPAAFFVLIFLLLRLRHGSRMKVCAKVLHTYPSSTATGSSARAPSGCTSARCTPSGSRCAGSTARLRCAR
ncbi:hypothetical protein [Streptomyces chartreusis]|uniref:hypothetical protein n=1 Tax=Streptomyces chartreusis TaxID=1969 RepID=UPI00378AA9D8